MSLVYSGGVAGGRFSVNRFVEVTSTTPAKLFGLYPRKGTVAVGSDADLVIFDPKKKQTLSAEDVSLITLAERVGTPFYCYSRATLERHYKVFAGALPKDSLVAFSVSMADALVASASSSLAFRICALSFSSSTPNSFLYSAWCSSRSRTFATAAMRRVSTC